jgi:Predicted nucleoside-diphosphate-sugar epimerases
MNKQIPTTLVLGSTGKTGSRVAADLINRGLPVRTAARSRADVTFDWSRRDSYAPALDGIGRVYLVAPVMRLDFADDVSAFLDKVEAAGVQHITFLSAYGMEHTPDEVATRSVELDLLRRQRIGHTILRPAWFMQNFSETFLKPLGGAILVPTGEGAEAFIDAEDIAAVAATTLADPQAHAGEAYSLTGPEALTIAEAAAIISDESGQTIKHVDLDREDWIAGAIANGIPPEYGPVLRQLTETIASGHGSRPNGIFEKITGTPPHTFRNFTHSNANAWKEAK